MKLPKWNRSLDGLACQVVPSDALACRQKFVGRGTEYSTEDKENRGQRLRVSSPALPAVSGKNDAYYGKANVQNGEKEENTWQKTAFRETPR